MTNLLKDTLSQPKGADISFWCDYIELRCLTHSDKKFSQSDLNDFVTENNDINIDEDFFSDLDSEEQHDSHETPQDERNDRKGRKIADLFGVLKSRQVLFKNIWPFSMREDLKEISVSGTPEDWALEQYLYIQLLLSSMLSYVSKKRSVELTSSFEHISKEIFTSLMPKHSEVHVFGADNSEVYTGKLYEKLKKLASDFRGTLVTEERKFPKQGRGDWNIDLVAWHPMGDERPHIPLALAQCGCSTTDWKTKMGDISNTAKGAHLHTNTIWAEYYFLPEDFAQLQGNVTEWPDYKYGYFQRAIVVDRLRTLRLAQQYEIIEKIPINQPIVKEAYSYSLT